MWVLRFQHENRGLSVPVTKPVLSVGRAEDRDVRLMAPGISRSHCEFFLDGAGGLCVRDTGSRLGVLREEDRLDGDELCEGDVLALGPVWVTVLREPTLDWQTPSGLWNKFPACLGPGTERGETVVPPSALVPLSILRTCLSSLEHPLDWGERVRRTLGFEGFEVSLATDGKVVCAWPAEWATPPETATTLSFDGSCGGWTAFWTGGKPHAGAILGALLPVLDLLRATRDLASAPAVRVGSTGPALVGMDATWQQVESLAASDLPILISGETGVGKEVLARAIHAGSTRAGRPLEIIHCAAIPEALFESELFGIEPRTASGVSGRTGRLAAAEGGTVLLDEIGEIPPAAQVKLLRVLESKTVLPVGGRVPVPLDVRWLAATNRDLREAVGAGAFREDLYYRLRGAEVEVPPLRRRRSSIPPLVATFLRELEAETPRRLQGVSLEAFKDLLAHTWPGNVRELKMEIKRTYFLAEPGGVIQRRHLSRHITEGASGQRSPEGQAPELESARRNAEGEAIRQALAAEGGSVTKAAARLGVSRQTLSKYLKALAIAPREFRPEKSS